MSPANWASLAKGVVQNVRRGTNIEDDLLVADLLITDAKAIQQVRDGLREVSCGYDAVYEQMEPGRGRQLNIIGNHVALVEKGRCGTRCAIGDSMTKTKWIDRLRAAFKARDEKELEEALKEGTADEESETAEEKEKREKAEKDKSTADAFSKALDELTERIDKLEKDKAKDKAAKDDESETAEEKAKREKNGRRREARRRRRRRKEEGGRQESARLRGPCFGSPGCLRSRRNPVARHGAADNRCGRFGSAEVR